MDAEPQRPEPSESVSAWLVERFGDNAFIVPTADELRGDAPEDVIAWLEAFAAWRDAREEWGKRQPFEWAPDSFAWRMYGGEWLSGRLVASTPERYVGLADAIASIAKAGASEETLRTIAEHVYGWRRVGAALVQRIEDAASEVRP